MDGKFTTYELRYIKSFSKKEIQKGRKPYDNFLMVNIKFIFSKYKKFANFFYSKTFPLAKVSAPKIALAVLTE